MMKKALTITFLSLLIFSRPALAKTTQADITEASIASNIAWQARSQAIATWMWLDIYNATLFTQPSFNPSELLDDQQPLKLELCYLKPIGREDLIKGAQAVLASDLSSDLKQAVNDLHQHYVDVKPGDCYVLEYVPERGTQLKLNNQLAFETALKGFKSVYFGIWLGQNPLSEPLKNKLLSPLEKNKEPLS